MVRYKTTYPGPRPNHNPMAVRVRITITDGLGSKHETTCYATPAILAVFIELAHDVNGSIEVEALEHEATH